MLDIPNGLATCVLMYAWGACDKFAKALQTHSLFLPIFSGANTGVRSYHMDFPWA